jgi:hypothetical protein
MTAEDELVLTQREPSRGWRFDLALPLIFRPRATLGRIVGSNTPTWRTPIALRVVAAVILALVAGSIKAAARAAGEVTLPPNFEFYTPEQQAQFQQAATASNNATFNYLLPALGAALGVVIVWLLVGGLLHLLLTLLGGRGTSRGALDVAAWASLPFLVRDAVQIVAMLLSDQLIAAPGLSGFAPAGEGFGYALLAGALSHVDIYLLWQIVLLYFGVRLSSQLPPGKCWLAVLLAVVVMLVLRALPGAIMAQFGGLTVIQPLF